MSKQDENLDSTDSFMEQIFSLRSMSVKKD